MAISVKTIISSGVGSSDVTASRNKVLAGYYTVTSDSNDEVVQGTVQEWDGSLCVTVNKPTNLTPTATHTGSEITNGYTCPTGVTMTGNDRGTDVGTYSATYTPNDGYAWSDGTRDSVTVVLTIEEVVLPYLCFTANTAGSTFKITSEGSYDFSTSTDGSTWTPLAIDSIVTLSNVGDKVYIKGNNPDGLGCGIMDLEKDDCTRFEMTGSISASGNIMSIIDNGACTTTTIPCNKCFTELFYQCTSLTSPPSLPATTLNHMCYYSLFNGCSNLTSVPKLPATDVRDIID